VADVVDVTSVVCTGTVSVGSSLPLAVQPHAAASVAATTKLEIRLTNPSIPEQIAQTTTNRPPIDKDT
jgi:hypothetical protein